MSVIVDHQSSESFEIKTESYSDINNENNNYALCEKANDIALTEKAIPLTYICCVCMERFNSVVAIEEHKINNHPNIFCLHIKTEVTDSSLELCKLSSNPTVELKQCAVSSLNTQKHSELNCTKCQLSFKSESDLYIHISECEKDKYLNESKNKRCVKKNGKKKIQKAKNKIISQKKKQYKSKAAKGNDLEELNNTVQNNEKLDDELLLEGETSEHFLRQHCCPHCLRPFAYLSSYRRHVKDICPAKKQLRKTNEINMKSRTPIPAYSEKSPALKSMIENSVLGLLRDQSRQSELMSGSELDNNSVSLGLRSFSCDVCHKIFLSFVKMLQHRLSHKLQSDKLSKLNFCSMGKLQNDLDNSDYEQ